MSTKTKDKYYLSNSRLNSTLEITEDTEAYNESLVLISTTIACSPMQLIIFLLVAKNLKQYI